MSFDIALTDGSIHVTTNNVPRDIVEAYELTEVERKEFDYIDWGEIERGEDSRSFVRFKGWTYDLGDCEGTFPHDRRWFYVSDSFFSGVLFRYPPEFNPPNPYYPDAIDTDRIICATYYVS